MKYQVFWSELAELTYLGILEHLLLYSANAASHLERKVIALTDRLAQFGNICPPAPNLPRYRKCVLTQHYSVICETQDSTVYLVAFIDNRAENLY
jgi:plasmid stabilization system protein ParE